MGGKRPGWKRLGVRAALAAALLGMLRGLAIAQDAGHQAPAEQGQQAAASSVDVLRAMAERAPVIFVGEVRSVRRLPGAATSGGVVDVTFAVEQAVRGALPGGSYVVREWAGLWAGGEQRYRVGQRRLMLLHAAGSSGLSSPVNGTDGAIPIVAADAGPVPADGAGSGQAVVDLRWIEARVPRPAAFASERVQGGSVRVEAHTPAVALANLVVTPASMAAAPMALTEAMGLLLGWEKARHGQR